MLDSLWQYLNSNCMSIVEHSGSLKHYFSKECRKADGLLTLILNIKFGVGSISYWKRNFTETFVPIFRYCYIFKASGKQQHLPILIEANSILETEKLV